MSLCPDYRHNCFHFRRRVIVFRWTPSGTSSWLRYSVDPDLFYYTCYTLYNQSKTKLHVPPRNPSKLHIIPDMSIIIIIIVIGLVNCYYDRWLYHAQRIYIYRYIDMDLVRIHGSVFAPQSNFINVTNINNNRSGLRWCTAKKQRQTAEIQTWYISVCCAVYVRVIPAFNACVYIFCNPSLNPIAYIGIYEL